MTWLKASERFSWLPTALAKVDRLTERQREVFNCLGAGMDNRTAAKFLGRSEATIRLHNREVTRRLDLESRLQAA
jgi:two-component system nitrate/nitrite response regulator NarL